VSNSCVLAIDTSAYTSSLALMSTTGQLLADQRQVLHVPAGQRGLRQSEALYQHVNNLPLLYERVFQGLDAVRISAVCVSTTPRPVHESFMPVFLAGTGMARCTAAALGVPLWGASHQEGHIWAALWSLPPDHVSTLQDRNAFLAIHLSGGTTEALWVQRLEDSDQQRLRLDLMGGTHDISAGQFVDRVGVALGLPFPAGPHLEALATQAEAVTLSLPIAVNNGLLSFSGPESAAQRAINAGVPNTEIAKATYICIANTLARWISNLLEANPVETVVLSGGVVASRMLRAQLAAHRRLKRVKLAFAMPEYSRDNAVGLAAWGAARIAGKQLLALPKRGVSVVTENSDPTSVFELDANHDKSL
jgi:N6-L-threonylcarbamoyladenine synthase